MQSTTITPQAFNALSTFEQKQLIAAHRAGRSNLQCVKDIFGEKQVPYTATAFHVDAGQAIFLDTSKANPGPWSTPVLAVELTPELIHELNLVGMCGTLGWELRNGGDLASIHRMAEKSL